MLTKAGLNAEAYFITSDKLKMVTKIKAHFVENLPVNSKITIMEDLMIKENDNVVVNGNVFKISQKIITKHPVKKTFVSCEYRLTLLDQLRKLPKFQEIIANQ
ncbi:hypothetical protein [Spiroplasma sp. SV19]|uniref:hypothetical protein n=1 Tax=Spiroplasma sp. SV19 TaxID=2570468 RepID=UPI0024B7DB56|nr:hypothetical protein [Spiroplasma sp. SV19]WHQ37109.1 hypothetical protein E7Y35_04350 [Spiroplasma sp. SV19]